MTSNPWHDIPLADYEAHMALPQVDQARLLSEQVARALDRHVPRSLAILGCAGGNGFEHAAARKTPRVVGIDIVPAYLDQARARWAARIPGLELSAADLQDGPLDIPPVDLAFAGLLFEYVDLARALVTIRSLVRPAGTLVAVLQLASAEIAEITPSPFTRLARLGTIMRLVPPAALCEAAAVAGFHAVDDVELAAASGKRFHVQTFVASDAQG